MLRHTFDLHHTNEISLEPADLALTLLAVIIFGVVFAFFRRMVNR